MSFRGLFSSSPGDRRSTPSRNSSSRQQRLEAAQQQEQRQKRRTFAFLNYKADEDERRRDVTKSRAHAKQLADAFEFDADFPMEILTPQSAVSAPQSRQQAFPTSSMLGAADDAWDNASVGSAYDMDFLTERKAAPAPAVPQAVSARPSSSRRRSKNSPAVDNFFGSASSFGSSSQPANERATISMPTMPTNSTMQSSYTRQGSLGSRGSASSRGGGAAVSGGGAAARRRMRASMRSSSNSSHNSQQSFHNSVSSAGSGDTSPASSYAPHGGSSPRGFGSTAPDSPSSSGGGSWSALSNSKSSGRKSLNQYFSGTSPPPSRTKGMSSAASFYSESSAVSRQSASNIFDTTRGEEGGFTFDAFGLDQSQVEREVNQALKELAGQQVPGFSMFLSPGQERKSSYNTQSNNDMSLDEDFGSQGWEDNSPATSRAASPAVLDQDGFVDGFRVQEPVNTRASSPPPTSSLPRQEGTPPRPSRNSARTPPRWTAKASGAHTMSPFRTPKEGPVNPWNEDPWRSGSDTSGPEDNDDSDTGGTASAGLAKAGFGYRSPQHAPPSLSQRSRTIPDSPAKSEASSDAELSILQSTFTQEFSDEAATSAHSSLLSPSLNPSRIQSLAAGFQSSVSNRATPPSARTSYVPPSSETGASAFSSEGGFVGGPSSDMGISSDVGVSSDVPPPSASSAPWNIPSEVTSKHKSNTNRYTSDGAGRAEEKKEEEVSTGGIGSLKSKWKSWENQNANVQATSTPQSTPPLSPSRSSIPKKTASSMASSLGGIELRTPAMMEARRQEARRNRTEALKRASLEGVADLDTAPSNQVRSASSWRNSSLATRQTASPSERVEECADQRTSFASLRERLRSTPTTTTKSEGGAAVRAAAGQKLMDRLKQSSPLNSQNTSPSMSGYRNSSPRSQLSDSKSDAGGSSPSFYQGVKLRSTGLPKSPSARTPRFQDRQQSFGETSLSEKAAGGSPSVPASPSRRSSPAKKLTYRERRELELQREREEEAKATEKSQVDEPPKRDVASLIKRRIAANKQNASKPYPRSDTVTENNGTQPLSTDFRAALKPTTPRSAKNETVSSFQDTVVVPEAAETGFSPEEETDTMPVSEESPAAEPEEHSHHEEVHTEQHTVTHQAVERQGFSPSALKPASRFRFDDVVSDADKPDVVHPLPGSRQLQKFVDTRKVDVADGSSVRSHETPATVATTQEPSEHAEEGLPEDPSDVRAILTNFLGSKLNSHRSHVPAPIKEDDAGALLRQKKDLESTDKLTSPKGSQVNLEVESTPPPPPATSGRVALKDDPKYERYFRMLKVGMPMEVVKHAMQRDGFDSSVMDGDHNKPVGLPLKEDPKYFKYFKMMKFGVSMDQVKHAMERDGLNPDVMDQDHDLPAVAAERRSEKKPMEKATHRRARLHWNTVKKVSRNSLWAKIGQDPVVEDIDIDEEEFNELFKAEMETTITSPRGLGASRKRGAAVRVIDPKRANNGGIILARLKMSHDDMADAVERIDDDMLSPEQIENIIEFLPTKEERKSLEKYMLEGDQDASEKFESLCECEKFMVSMMTVKHAKRKVRALLFKLQFMSCLESIAEDTTAIETACDELQSSTRLRQILGIVLQFGNRLNTAGAQDKKKAGAFTLDSLLKLSQAKAFDKKTTFLNYIVLIVQRNNELLLNFQGDLPTVLKADKVYWDQCLTDLEEVENQLENVRRIALYQARSSNMYRTKAQKSREDDEESLGDVDMSLEEEVESLRSTAIGLFTLSAIKQVSALRDKVESTGKKFRKVLEYFGEEENKLQPHELFKIFTSFCRDFEKAKEKVFKEAKKKEREERKNSRLKQQKNTPSKGRPPAGPDRTPIRAPLKASSFQPSMSKVIDDIRNQPRKSPTRSPLPPVQQPMPSENVASSSISHRYTSQSAPRSDLISENRQAQVSEQPVHRSPRAQVYTKPTSNSAPPPPQPPRTSSQSIAAAASSRDSLLRQKARMMRSRPAPMGGGNAASSAVKADGASTSLASTASAQDVDTVGSNPQTLLNKGLSPKSAIRQRRRMEARRRMTSKAN